jgi:hypothetical protein
MKKSRVFILLTGFVLGALVVCWSRAQMPSEKLKVMLNGVEIHTLMSDNHNALVGYLEAAGQTNALELFRQYRGAYSADLMSSDIRDTVVILKYLRDGNRDQAIYNLEQRLHRDAGQICNNYGGLNETNRARVKLDSLEQARDYFAMHPHPEWGTNTEYAVSEVLRLAGEKAGK